MDTGGKSSPGKEWQVQRPRQETNGVFMEQCRGLDHTEGARVEVEADCGGPWFRSLVDYSPQRVTVQPGAQPHTPGEGAHEMSQPQGKTDQGDTGTNNTPPPAEDSITHHPTIMVSPGSQSQC